MKLYLLRHQIRGGNILFGAPLTEEGQHLAITDTLPMLEELKITQIYSSPYFRVLQTIEPYIKKYGCQIKIEYALQEHLRTVAFDIRNYNRVSGKEWADYFNIDLTYISNCGKIVALETSEDVANRIENFVNYIVGMYKDTSENILIATHQVIVHYIMSMFGKTIPEHGVGMGDIIEISL